MPWEIRERDGQFCVVKEDSQEVVKCHVERADAVDHLRALYSNVPEARTAALSGAEGGSVAGAPAAAGVALVAADTGRVLMIQRAMIEGEAACGKWEFPGGRLEEGEGPAEGAAREFAEEVGHELPPGEPVATWLSANGIYQGFVWLTPEETADHVDGSRSVDDPDNPDQSNYTEAVAWFDPADLRRRWNGLREECKDTPWSLIVGATPSSPADYEEGAVAVTASNSSVEVTVSGDGLGPPPAGEALPDGEYPVPDVAFLKRAIEEFARDNESGADRAEARDHIIRRAYELDALELIPEEWLMSRSSITAAVGAPASSFLPAADLPGPTPFGVVGDGPSVDGHLALWASCHTGFPGTCVRPPREQEFPFFNLGEAVTADGHRVSVGKVTVGGGHAGPDLSWRTAALHYDESGTAVAVVHAVADRWGIRLPGCLVASAGEERVDELRRSPLSGDWRRIDGRLRLIAALGVNVPGYAIPRTLVASGETESLVFLEDWEAELEAAAAAQGAASLAASVGLDHATRARLLFEQLLNS